MAFFLFRFGSFGYWENVRACLTYPSNVLDDLINSPLFLSLFAPLGPPFFVHGKSNPSGWILFKNFRRRPRRHHQASTDDNQFDDARTSMTWELRFEIWDLRVENVGIVSLLPLCAPPPLGNLLLLLLLLLLRLVKTLNSSINQSKLAWQGAQIRIKPNTFSLPSPSSFPVPPP